MYSTINLISHLVLSFQLLIILQDGQFLSAFVLHFLYKKFLLRSALLAQFIHLLLLTLIVLAQYKALWSSLLRDIPRATSVSDVTPCSLLDRRRIFGKVWYSHH